MKNSFPPIFDICHCGKCNEIVYGGKKYYKLHRCMGTFHTEETKEKMRKNHRGMLGKHHSEETKEKMRRPKSEETKRKLSKSHKGKIVSEETKRKQSQSRMGKIPWNKGLFGYNSGENNHFYGKHHTEEIKKKLSEYTGELASNWQGGLSFLPYCYKFNKILKNNIRERDNYQCQYPDCLITQLESMILYNKSLYIHHIHYDKPNCNPDLITLCSKHNSKVNFDRNYHEQLFMKILEKRELLI